MNTTKEERAKSVEPIYQSYRYWKNLAMSYMGKYGKDLALEFVNADKDKREEMAMKLFNDTINVEGTVDEDSLNGKIKDMNNYVIATTTDEEKVELEEKMKKTQKDLMESERL